MQANEMRLGGRREGVSDWWVFWFLGFWGFGGAPFFLFLFFSEKRGVLGGGDSSFFKFLQLLESRTHHLIVHSLFYSRLTQQMIPHLRRHLQEPKRKKKKKKRGKEKKTHPNIGPPVPKNKLKLPTFIHVGNFSHPT